jgi:hypothetical protein
VVELTTATAVLKVVGPAMLVLETAAAVLNVVSATVPEATTVVDLFIY